MSDYIVNRVLGNGKRIVIPKYPGWEKDRALLEEADRRGISPAELKKGRPLTEAELKERTGLIAVIVDGGDY